MKKLQLSILPAVFASQVLAQSYYLPTNYRSETQDGLSSMRIVGDSEDYNNSFYGDWAITGVGYIDLNYTTTEGSAYFQNGNWTDSQELRINDAMSGYLCSVTYRTSFSDQETFVYADDDEAGVTSGSYHGVGIGDRSYNQYQMGSWTFSDGTYKGASDYNGLMVMTMSDLEIEGTSFIGGDASASAWGSSGIHIGSVDQTDEGATSIVIDNETGNDRDMIKAGDYNGDFTVSSYSYDTDSSSPVYGSYVVKAIGGSGMSAYADSVTIYGGDFYGSQTLSGTRSAVLVDYLMQDAYAIADGGAGIWIGGSSSTEIYSGNFIAGDSGDAYVAGDYGTASANGGDGAYIGGSATITNATFSGADGGYAYAMESYYLESDETWTNSGYEAKAYAVGGSGLRTTGAAEVSDATATGGDGGDAEADFTENVAYASGGNGFASGSSAEVNGGTYTGGEGGTASAEDGSIAQAWGGAGVYSSGKLTINGGEFTGGDGGKATSETGTASAFGGAGAFVDGADLVINGGTFTGGAGGKANGELQQGEIGVLVMDGSLEITESVADTLINGDILFDNSSAESMDIEAGSITGDITISGAGLATITVGTNANYAGAFILAEGDADVSITDEAQGEFFSDVAVASGSALSFEGTSRLVTKENASISLYGDATLTFSQGAYLSKGSSLDANYGTVTSSANLEMAENTSMSFKYATSFDTNGVSSMSGGSLVGNLIATNDTAKIKASGTAAAIGETVQLTSGSLTLYTNVDDFVSADFGFLIDEQITDDSGIKVTMAYNSLTNSFKDIDADYLAYYDAIIQTNLTEQEFYALNSGGSESLRYGISQMPDVSESSFKISQEINKQLAARGTEFRSMNGFVSTDSAGLVGVAGPTTDEEKTMQGWVRAYGGKGSRDSEGTFTDYDSTFWGTVVGIDKSFGNLLIGLAGGYGRTDIDATYDADVETYHGSLYSTFGGESLYVDGALTFGWNSSEEESSASKGKFDSQTYSAYIGAGYAFDIGNKVSLTPEASLLASFYQQDEYDRTGILEGTVGGWDTSSFLGTIGMNLASQHQIDWLNRGIALIPELRAHYIHEFNADPEDFSYTAGGQTANFAVRPRDESMFRFGLGCDVWNWRYQNTKFEIDYDGLFSDTYGEHVVSGKITWRF